MGVGVGGKKHVNKISYLHKSCDVRCAFCTCILAIRHDWSWLSGLTWALRRLKALGLRLLAQLPESNAKEDTRDPHNWLIVRGMPRWIVTFNIISLILKYHIIALVIGLPDLVVGKLRNYIGSMSCLTPADWFEIDASEAILRMQMYISNRIIWRRYRPYPLRN